ncbi:sulfurtransferase [Zooshikella marina]|uniref:sulfurtransferase n=1 Tax=Zooshikella ganghwensis TaxID=202772 RepID=UPI001BAF8D7A|nr:sulfurtransferase [Zooshikella ganghwensis]MBU2708163.1 sulfurtransferase [Zooshikella ganghwensis]
MSLLLSTFELNACLNDTNTRVVDCRFALDDPDYGLAAYQQSHIPGAVFLDLNKDLSAPVVPGVTGRHPLPHPNQLAAKLERLGISSQHKIVIYDDADSAKAARLWWLLLWLGKSKDVYLLDGGYQAWMNDGFECTSVQPEYPAAQFDFECNNAFKVEVDEVLSNISSEQIIVLDARSYSRFTGEEEPIDPVAGHIPGAVCCPYTENLDQNAKFKSSGELLERFQYLGVKEVSNCICYCGSGVTACHNIFSMQLAGLPMPKLYAGSWSEWITNPQRPVSKQDAMISG